MMTRAVRTSGSMDLSPSAKLVLCSVFECFPVHSGHGYLEAVSPDCSLALCTQEKSSFFCWFESSLCFVLPWPLCKCLQTGCSGHLIPQVHFEDPVTSHDMSLMWIPLFHDKWPAQVS
jgi:hypothetical protein